LRGTYTSMRKSWPRSRFRCFRPIRIDKMCEESNLPRLTHFGEGNNMRSRHGGTLTCGSQHNESNWQKHHDGEAEMLKVNMIRI
jgi:hypothetical protein